jgi:hypothetical protein
MPEYRLLKAYNKILPILLAPAVHRRDKSNAGILYTVQNRDGGLAPPAIH